jgi:hypothetical protein
LCITRMIPSRSSSGMSARNLAIPLTSSTKQPVPEGWQ